MSYGARVYVDRGEPDTVYTSAAVEGDAEDGVDTSVPDHYFWFGPGETEYVVRGFFADSESSWPFQFGSAAASRRSLGSHNVADDEPEPKRARSSVSSADVRLAKEIGCVRVQFCKVVQWMKPLRHAATPRRASLPGSAAELCDRKGARVVAKAGTATVKDKEAATVEKEAVLSDKILHECRVFFNDFGGYRAQATMGAAMLEPLTFRGLPLSALRQPDVVRGVLSSIRMRRWRALDAIDAGIHITLSTMHRTQLTYRQTQVRRRCIETFLRALQRDGSEKAAQTRLSGWGFGLARASTRGATEDTDNAKVAVKRVAKFACEILSPAASKIVCAGSTDADEALYQTFAGLTDKERFADLDAHATALGEYLVNRPDLYEVTATKSKGWLSTGTEYSVSFAELVIE